MQQHRFLLSSWRVPDDGSGSRTWFWVRPRDDDLLWVQKLKITWLNPQLDLTVDDMIFAILVTYEWLVFHLVIYHWFYPRTRSKINNFVLGPIPGPKFSGPLWTKKWAKDDLGPESGSFLNWLSMLDSFFLAQQPGPTSELLTLELLTIRPDRLK